MTPPSEDVIRDELAKRLNLLEPGLTLTDLEFHLPSEEGARGFVDIVARDRTGMIVLVELKRSTAASRQAIQELLKYLALLVANHGISRSQIRCLIVSTSWHELSAPYAELVRSGAFQFEGFLLEVDSSGVPTRASLVDAESAAEINLHQPYLFECYEEREHRDRASELVCIRVRAESGANCLIIHQDYVGEDTEIAFKFGMSICIAEIAAPKASEQSHDDENDDIDSEWDLINSATSNTAAADFASHSAAQFVAHIVVGWKPVKFVRAGPWESSKLWSDDSLLKLASGFESDNGIYLRFVSSPKNHVDWQKRSSQVAKLFEPDRLVGDIVLALLSEFAVRHPKGTVGFSAFYPEDLLRAVCSAVITKDDGFAPDIEIVLIPPESSADKPVTIRVMLCWDRVTRPSSAPESVVRIYGSAVAYQLACVTHEHFGFRRESLTEIGLEWRVFEITGKNESARRVTLSGAQLIRESIDRNSIPWLRSFAIENWDWVCDLAFIVTPRQFKIVRPIGTETYFAHGPTACCRCERPFESHIYDTSLPPNGTWGCICEYCFNFLGCSVGWGVGQEFTRLSDGGWYLTDGARLDDSQTEP